MQHSDIVALIENVILSAGFDIINVTGISTHVIDTDGYEVIPGKKLKAGVYGVVELRVMLPINPPA